MRRLLLALVAVAGGAGAASVASAQVEPRASLLAFEVWNGSAWVPGVSVLPGSRVEYRVSITYTGTSTLPVGLGSVRYQPTFSNADNTGPSVDTNLPFRNNGTSGSGLPGTMLSAAEGQSGEALPSYGRVVFGSPRMQSSTLNVLTQFRHSDGSNGAPQGSFIRLAGNGAPQWPLPTMSQPQATTVNLGAVTRGVVGGQTSQIDVVTGVQNTNYVGGTQNLVIFRGAFQLSDATDARTIVLSSAAGSQDRVGGANEADDTRFMTWHTDVFGTPYRTSVDVSDAQITVVPTPGVLGVLGVGALFATRRRR